MKLSIDEAAIRLGKTRRQVQYLIQTDRLKAEKVDNRWYIEASELPPSPGQQQARERKARRLRAAVDEALEVPTTGKQAERYSVRDLKAFQIASDIYRQTCAHIGPDHPASLSIWQCILELGRGCHRYRNEEKSSAYGTARDHASESVCHLLFHEHEQCPTQAQRIEQDLMPAIAGLMRRVDRDQRRTRPGP